MNDSIGTGGIVHCLDKEISFLTIQIHFTEPIKWRFSFIEHRKILLVEIQSMS
jgi:hypothetical protein